VVTACSPETQMARLVARGLTEDAARQRLAAQWPTERKVERADFVIRTDGTFDDTHRQIDDVLLRLQTSDFKLRPR
jgi:dephospho-CoA kinase